MTTLKQIYNKLMELWNNESPLKIESLTEDKWINLLNPPLELIDLENQMKLDHLEEPDDNEL